MTEFGKKLPNPSAEYLEEHLGISFDGNPPQVVELNFINILRFSITKRGEGCAGKLGTLVALMFMGNNNDGVYIPEDDVYLVRKGDLGLSGTAIHENVHAWQNRVNPSLSQSKLNIYNVTTRLALSREPSEDLEGRISELLANCIIKEGMAEWAEISLAKLLEGEDKRRAIERELCLTYSCLNWNETQRRMFFAVSLTDYKQQLVKLVISHSRALWLVDMPVSISGIGYLFVRDSVDGHVGGGNKEVEAVLRKLLTTQFTTEEIVEKIMCKKP